jgi:hypothetical protein
MKKQIISTILLFFSFLLVQNSKAQTNSAQANLVAQKIAKKIKDTLGLTAQQRNQLFQVNMDLNNQKQQVRQQTTIQDSLVARFQRIENKRDTLYFPILGAEKYQLYLQKKRNLVNNN